MAQLRNTQQKKLISELMQDNISHPTADDIYLRARTIDAHISRGTVYRNLNLLAAQGSIRRINLGNIPCAENIELNGHVKR